MGLEHILQIELISNEHTDMIRHDAVSLIFCVHGDMRIACGSEDISLKKDQFYKR